MNAGVFKLSGLDPGAAGPRAILRVLQVLEYLATHPQGRSLAQMCEELQLPKTSLYTLLKTLQSSGHLELAQSLYRLGPPAVSLGAAMVGGARRSFPEGARERLESLSRRTGETSFLSVLTGDGMHCRYLQVVESGNWLRFSVQPNSIKPAYATGTGRAMLAYLPKDDLEAILARVQFEKLTHKTVSSRSALLAALARVRRERVSVSDSGTVSQVMSVAAPIFDAQGKLIAAISAGGPTVRMAPQLVDIERVVRSTAEDISRDLGFAGAVGGWSHTRNGKIQKADLRRMAMDLPATPQKT